MCIAIIGSRGLWINDLGKYLPHEVTEIISGGANGIDSCARAYAIAHNILLTEFLPEYAKYGRAAPLRRNISIVENADLVLAFWDSISRGTKCTINACKRMGVPIKVIARQNNEISPPAI